MTKETNKYQESAEYIANLNLLKPTKNIGNQLYNSKLPIFRIIKTDPNVVAGGNAGFKLLTRKEALASLEDDFQANDDISEANNQCFRRDIKSIECSQDSFFIFTSSDDSYEPLNKQNLKKYLIYVLTYARKRYLDTDITTSALSNIEFAEA